LVRIDVNRFTVRTPLIILCLLATDAGVCYDESERCIKFANDGKCINSALHKFANFCKKACGLCGLSSNNIAVIYNRSFPTNHSSSRKTRINVLSYGIKIWAELSFVLSHCTRLTGLHNPRVSQTDRQNSHR